jgi:hypothetical protein
MALTDRRAYALLAGLGILAVVGAWRMKIPSFFGDSATYHSMAWSLAEDLDLRYEARDLLRVRREMKSGPEGLFLKKTSGALGDQGDDLLYFAKPYLYPLCAAPFVAVFRSKALYATNAAFLAAALALAYAACRRRRPPAASLTLTLAVVLGGLTPMFIAWPAPELLYFALATIALCLWQLDRPYAACVIVGALTYAKPPHIFLAIPLLWLPLLSWRLAESVRRGLLVVATTALFFGGQIALTGEVNYQAGERKTFYGRFPFERHGLTWENTGIWMSTNQVGPQAEGTTTAPAGVSAEPPRKPAELRLSFIRNLGYFWVGRFAGAVPYFLPVVVALAFFFVQGVRARGGAWTLAALAAWYAAMIAVLPDAWYPGGQPLGFLLLALYMAPLLATAFVMARRGAWEGEAAFAWCALFATYVFYIWMIPDNWYGGSGTVGNRYFLPLVPLALFFAPRGREAGIALAAVVSAALLLRPIFLAPLYHSMHPGAHATRDAFRVFPPELTMLNDLSAFTEPWRKKQPIGDFGDPDARVPADPRAYYLYFLDNGTLGQEPRKVGETYVHGFWLRGKKDAEVILRMLDIQPIERVRMAVTGGPAGDEISIGAFGRRQALAVSAGETKEAAFAGTAGFPYKDTFLHVVKLRSTKEGTDRFGRSVGSYVQIFLDVAGDVRTPAQRPTH